MTAEEEFKEFCKAIGTSKPAIETFTNTGLMMMYLMMGKDCLRKFNPLDAFVPTRKKIENSPG